MEYEESGISKRKRTNIMLKQPMQVTIDQPAQAGRPIDTLKDSAIMEAARALLFEKGPQAITMEAVAKKAGVSKVTVYARHKNRDELLLAVIQSQIAGFTGIVPEVQTSMSDVREAMINFSVNIMGFQVSQEHLQLMRAISAANNIPDQLLQEVFILGPQNMLEWISQWLASLDKAGFIRCDSPMMSAELFAGMLQRMDNIRALYRVSVDYSVEELQKQAVFVVDAFLKMHRLETE